MYLNRISRVLCLITVLAVPVMLLAQATPTAQPSAEEVIAKSIEVTGGKDAYAKIKTRIVTAKLNIPAQNLSGPVTTYMKEPNSLLVNTTFAGAGQFDQGFDGKVGWEKSDLEGVRLISGDELERTQQMADAQAELNWKAYYTSATNSGIADVDGKSCYKIDLVTKGGKPETRFYEVASGLLLRTDMDMDTSRGNVKVTAIMSDWRDAGGIKMPFAATQKIAIGGLQMEYKLAVEKVENNAEIPAEKFALPAEVAELVKQQAKDAPATQPAGK